MADLTTGAMQEFGGSAPPDAQGKGPSAGLVLLYAEAFEKLPAAFPFSRRQQRIGREPSAAIAVQAPAVSRNHAELRWERGVWLLRDCQSRNGTLVDGVRIDEIVLEPMHELRIGDSIFKFVDRGAEHYAHFRIDGVSLGGAGRQCRQPTELVGGFLMDTIAAQIERLAPTELSVVLLGESGTGKEVVARELHRMSGRRGNFSAVNCAAIPAALIESELFGYKRGAFSGADRDKPGLIRSAHQGTLLLDEIGDMPLEAQTKLLRVLQSKEIYPVGATSPERVEVRVVCATHRDLEKLMRAERFRADLFARLNEYQLRLPPLRERKEDLYLLLRTFLARYGRPDLQPSFQFMTALIHYDWPFNVRELEACAKRCAMLAEAALLTEEQLPEAVRDAMADYGREPGSGANSTLPTGQAQPSSTPEERELILLLEKHRGNVAAVGRDLGKARMQVHRWMQRYGINVNDYR